MRASFQGDARHAPVTNLLSNPATISNLNWTTNAGYGASSQRTYQIDSDGHSFIRLTYTVSNTSVTNAGHYPIQSGTPNNRIPIQNDRTPIYATAEVRASLSEKWRIFLECYDQNGTVITSGGDVNYTTPSDLPANTWNRIHATLLPRPGTAYITPTFYIGTPLIYPVGTTIDLRNAMVAQTPYALQYADGYTLNWKWTGATNSSPSVGMPSLATLAYWARDDVTTLEAIAGSPFVSMTGLGTRYPIEAGIDPLSPVTIYFHYIPSGNMDLNFPTYLQFGGVAANTGRISIQGASTGNSGVRARFDTQDGSVNVIANVPAIRTVTGGHVFTVRMPAGLAVGYASVDGGTEIASAAINPGLGIRRSFVSPTSTPEINRIRTLVYNADHDESKRQAIITWLRTHPTAQ